MKSDMHYTEYLSRVRGCILGLGDMSWIEPALRVVAKNGMDFTGEQLAALKAFQINVVAEAIQTSDNFANADEAWAAFDAQK